jgi:predicted site-specific integrase-resolvase
MTIISDVDRCTFAWAAEKLGVSVQQVGRYARDGVLTTVIPKCGQRESTRRWLLVDEVLALAEARKVVGRG